MGKESNILDYKHEYNSHGLYSLVYSGCQMCKVNVKYEKVYAMYVMLMYINQDMDTIGLMLLLLFL